MFSPCREIWTPELICDSARDGAMGTVSSLPTRPAGVRLADAVKVFLDTIPATNTRRGYGIVLNRLVADFGADTNVALLVLEPDRVSGWFTFVWDNKAATTFNVRLAALR